MPGTSVSLHTDLYRYWEAKRGARAMPARRDIEPAEIPALLPYLTLIDRRDGHFRYRLVGTAVAEELGRDMTGQDVGSYVSPPEYAAALAGIYERVFSTGRALFTTGEYRGRSAAIHAVSRLMLPLGADGQHADMVLFTRIARFHPSITAGADWLKGASGKVCDIAEVGSAEDIAALSRAWERACEASNAAA